MGTGIVRLARRIVGTQTVTEIHEAAVNDAEAKRAFAGGAAQALVEAKARWRAGQAPDLWQAVRAAEDAVDQARDLADEADATARTASADVAEEIRAKDLAELDAEAWRLNEITAFVAEKDRRVVTLAQAVVREYVDIQTRADEYQRALRELQERAARLRAPMPTLDTAAPRTAAQIVRHIQVSVQKQHGADGVDYTTSQRAVALIEGTFK